jgi:acyl-coenzyme A thioesterase PaaI-like protein
MGLLIPPLPSPLPLVLFVYKKINSDHQKKFVRTKRVAQMSTASQNALVQQIPFAARTGVEIISVKRGHVKVCTQSSLFCKKIYLRKKKFALQVKMPLIGNHNHFQSMYAGALFTLAELPGGLLCFATFDTSAFFPIVTEMTMKFIKPARTDVFLEVNMSEEEIERINKEANEKGMAKYQWTCELKDANGILVAISTNKYQLRSNSTASKL